MDETKKQDYKAIAKKLFYDRLELRCQLQDSVSNLEMLKYAIELLAPEELATKILESYESDRRGPNHISLDEIESVISDELAVDILVTP